jgi:hypothetical protein
LALRCLTFALWAAAAAPASLAPPPCGAFSIDGAPQDAAAPAEPGERALTVTDEHRRAVERALAWLAGAQAADGSWSGKIGYKLNNDYRWTDEGPHVGVTALAGLAFLAGGELPGRGIYGERVERALAFVLSAAQEDGYISRQGTRMYEHAFATLFLAEVYGATARADVRARLQDAVDFIVRAQNAEGGWRYEPLQPDSDMSIVVCQVMALRAARNIGIRVPKSTVDRATQYVVDSAITEDELGGFHGQLMHSEIGAFRYQSGSGSRSSFPLTSAGVTALHGLGIYSDERILQGLEYLRRNQDLFDHDYGARAGPGQQGHYFFWYGHYYAVQAMYTAGEPFWTPYFQRLRAELVGLQRADGSFPNTAGPGASFSTAMAALILEIPYRFLPIFQR